ncbi:hypothetical protein D0T60_16205 [Bacteroides sp. 224]|nr:hypothetical protein [Bacteroides sp. 224]
MVFLFSIYGGKRPSMVSLIFKWSSAKIIKKGIFGGFSKWRFVDWRILNNLNRKMGTERIYNHQYWDRTKREGGSVREVVV